MAAETITAAAAGTWRLGDLTVNRVGFGAMRLTGSRDRAIAVLQRAIEVRNEEILAWALRLSTDELARLDLLHREAT